MGDDRFEILRHIEAIWRRRWMVLCAAWIVCVIGWLVVAALPDKYESKARIYVDTGSLLGPLLKGLAVENDFKQEVALMERTLLSRPNLAQVARATDLDLTVTTPVEMQELLDSLLKRADIAADGPNLFSVTFKDTDPVLTKNVVQSLLTIFIENNLGRNRANMEGARTFIEKQIGEYQAQLKEAERQVAEFKSKNIDMLTTGNFSERLADSKYTHRKSKREYEEALLRRDQLKAQIKETPQFLEIDAFPQVIVGGVAESPIDARIRGLEQALSGLRLRFTDEHPDVITTKRSLEMVIKERDAQLASEAGDGSGEPGSAAGKNKAQVPNALYNQLKLMLIESDAKLISVERTYKDAEADVNRLEKMRLTAPGLEAELTDLNRDYTVIKAKFEELLGRRESARISQAVEVSTDTVQFRIIEPPEVPAIPSSPNRPLLLSVVLIVGIGAGAAFAFLLGQLDDSFRTADGLKESFGLPVLGSVTRVVNSVQRRRRMLSNVGFGAISSALVTAFATVVIFVPQFSQLPEALKQLNLPQLLDGLL